MVIISANLFGVLGMLLAAPVLASLKLILTYLFRKLMDQDPWSGLRVISPPEPFHIVIHRLIKSWGDFFVKVWKLLQKFWLGLTHLFNKKQPISKGEKNE